MCRLPVGIDSLSVNDVKTALSKLQLWMIKFARTNSLEGFGEQLLAINEPYDEDSRIDEKKNAPTKSDSNMGVDDLRDESATFFVLDTLHKVLSAILRVNDVYRPQTAFVETDLKQEKLNSFPATIVEFCIEHLSHAYSSGIRHVSGLCLGVLSEPFLGEITQLLIRKLVTVKGGNEAQERGWVTYQHALKFIKFGMLFYLSISILV